MFERIPNKMLEKIRSGKAAYGMQSYIHTPELYEVAGWAGLDFTMIDIVHCRLDYDIMVNFIRTCEMTGLTPLVTVSANEQCYVRYYQ